MLGLGRHLSDQKTHGVGEEQSSKKTQVPRKRISVIIESQKLFPIAQVRDIRIPLRYPINILQAS